MTLLTEFTESASTGFTAAIDQPYTYVRKELSNRIGVVTRDGRRSRVRMAGRAMAASAFRQEHSAAARGDGDLLDERFYIDLAADQQQRATCRCCCRRRC